MSTQEPEWLREIDTVLCVHPQLVVAGNVRDRFLVPRPDGAVIPMDLTNALAGVLLRRGYGTLLRYVPGLGVTVAAGTDAGVAQVAGGRSTLSAPDLADLVAAVSTHLGAPVALLVEYSSQLTGSDGTVDDAVRGLLSRARHSALTAAPAGLAADGRSALPYNTVFWVADREHDLPTWFVDATPTIRLISVPLPAAPARMTAARICLRRLQGAAEATDQQREAAAADLVAATDGMPLRAVLGTADLAVDQRIPLARVRDAAVAYRTGVVEDPWRDPDTRARIAAGEKELSQAVRGQGHAVRKALDLLTRSVMGLNGAQAGGGGARPRGVLFFAGPTGVGKTELAKAITRLVFGDEDSYLRFDMSEFSAEHSEARLVGAPPGYTGFDAGGQLTSAVRARPFRVILFDEIDKAHPRILDKFLQILEDGRLTDGRGSTVLFSDTLLIFTSNKGVLVKNERGAIVENVTAAMDREEVDERVREAIAEFFRREIERPELLNRIGDGVVVFDFIRRDVAEELLGVFLGRVAGRLEREHGLRLEVAPAAMHTLRTVALSDLRHGGRGVATTVESMVVNPLARWLFQRGHAAPAVCVEAFRLDADGVWAVDVT
ncbi:chaperone [Actinomycetospora sp. NBRC 106375]|uniref:AAA family ATPase n=1 Tax=Actinomycetospora sp. NBRC 106375 TaxID=3032207 RepID=UPI0024A34AF0|nr:AAA family ATPase [Actinomycetospora sp. NBRC 106375]GLZ50113.1 chaperone [Actinomycetospora sp. NBRC 106375]